MSSEEDNNAEDEVSFDDELTVITDVNNLTDVKEDQQRSGPTGDNKGQDGYDGKGKRKTPDVKDSSENFIPPGKRFKVVSQSDAYKWVLPNSMSE